jgi:hypothetical protein
VIAGTQEVRALECGVEKRVVEEATVEHPMMRCLIVEGGVLEAPDTQPILEM